MQYTKYIKNTKNIFTLQSPHDKPTFLSEKQQSY